MPRVDAWLAELFDPEHIDNTCQALASATEPDAAARRDELRQRIAELDGYRTVMRNEPDAAATVGTLTLVSEGGLEPPRVIITH